MSGSSVALTEFHAKPGEVIDRSQAGPITLTKRNRAYAVVVSADWFDRAEQAMAARHGNRRVVAAENLSDEDRDFILEHGPTDEEVRTGEWRS